MTERHSWDAGARDAEIEDLLRRFYAAEMPADLRSGAVAPASPDSSKWVAAKPAPVAVRAGRGLGLTAVAASLMLAASAFVLTTRGTAPDSGSESPGDSGGSHADARPAAPADPDAWRVQRRPVELLDPDGQSVPAGVKPTDEPDHDFPEFDIRILPIEGDGR